MLICIKGLLSAHVAGFVNVHACDLNWLKLSDFSFRNTCVEYILDFKIENSFGMISSLALLLFSKINADCNSAKLMVLGKKGTQLWNFIVLCTKMHFTLWHYKALSMDQTGKK